MSVLPLVAALAPVGKIAPVLPPGPLRHVAETAGNPVGKAVGAVIDRGHRAIGTAQDVGSSAGREATRLFSPSGLPKSGQAAMGSRLFMAVLAGIITLEVVATLSGRWFQWSAPTGVANMKAAGQYIGLIPGQTVGGAPPAAAPAADTGAVPASAPANPYAAVFAATTFDPYAGAPSFRVVPNPAAVPPPSPNLPPRNPQERIA